MSAPPTTTGEIVTTKRQLVDWLAQGCKPRAAWRIGTEHEKFVFRRGDRRPVPYEGPDGIAALLRGLERFGWEPVPENGNPVALHQGLANISLEPGGQFELSGAPVETLHDTAAELDRHFAEAGEVTRELGLGMLGMGFNPKWRRDDIPWMPKARYRIMREYMPKKGGQGLDMMLRTCTVQVNLDFESEADMARKFRAGLALQPIATALFAASPFVEGRPAGYRSWRSQVWTDTDPDRCGILPFVFERGFGFERYTDWLLDVPMYFVYRDGRYIDAAGQSFRDFMAGRLPALPGERPRIGDWTDHVSTAFPEVRLKRYLEMRGADAGPVGHLRALPALWVGLLYDEAALDAALALVADWTSADHDFLRREVPRQGTATPFRGASVRDVAEKTVTIAREGLRRRARDEASYLAPLVEIAGSGRTLADRMEEDFERRWAGRIDPIFDEYAY